MELSPGPWLTARRLQEIGEAVAQRNGVRVAW
jgi:hypothetical protein